MNISWMSRNRATRPLIRYSLCPERYRRRLTTTSPGRATGAGASAAFFLRRGFDSTPAGAPLNESSLAASTIGPAISPLSAGPAFPASPSAAAPSSTNRAASANSGSSSVMVTSARPIGGRFVVPLKMQSAMRSARSVLWLCSPSTQETASTTFDFPQPFGPTMHVIPLPLNVTAVRSQNDLKPVISTFLSLSKVPSVSLVCRRNGKRRPKPRETCSSSPSGGGSSEPKRNRYAVALKNVWQVPSQRPSRLARRPLRGRTRN